MTPLVSAERLLGDIAELAAIGGRPDGGVDRLAGSPADLEGRRWVAATMTAAGLRAELDSINNVFGRPPGMGPWLLLGSHTDTVPAGGRLDGAYGVLAALEVVRTLRDAGHPAVGRIAVADFHNEEGVLPTGFDGSEHFCAGPWLAAVEGYLELHIEQGPRLEAAGQDLAVVSGIVGIDRYEVRVAGEANHAGTTPFSLRRDAGRTAGRLLAGLRELVQGIDPAMVANIGSIVLLPGAPNVVPGSAEFTVEVRSLSAAALQEAGQVLAGEVARLAEEEGCTAMLRPVSAWAPQPMDAGYIAAVTRALERSGLPFTSLVSGAGHDAEVLARHVPAAMLFVPSHRGISHSPSEHTDDRFLIQGCQALLAAALEVLSL